MPRLDIFSPDGLSALGRAFASRPLAAFDFDGTLVPIARDPDRVRLRPDLAAALAVLNERVPVAVISGRSAADLAGRLGFRPAYLVGSHGADDPLRPTPIADRPFQALRLELEGARAQLRAVGISIEDKPYALALHYRHAPDRRAALNTIRAALRDWQGTLRIFGGKLVVNVTPAGAPDKANALSRLVALSATLGAVFVGDDVNDEPVFERAAAHWVTIRVGRADARSSARFAIASPAGVHRLVRVMLDLSNEPGTRPGP
jgi:trehalose 6-phosphate phosphatase